VKKMSFEPVEPGFAKGWWGGDRNSGEERKLR